MGDWWRNRPWRMIQTNLREIDMRDISAARVVADMKAFAANVLMLNAAGIIASYPTDLPFHFQSPHLTGDGLDAIIAACHDADIRVIARTDFSKMRRPIYEAHPEWAYVSGKGKIVDYNGDVHACINGGFQQDCAPLIIREVLTKCDFDGIFFNMAGYVRGDYSGNYYGICHCDSCRRAFDEMFALPLPPAENMDDPAFRKYLLFQQRTLRAYHEKIYRVVRDIRPGLCIANHMEFGEGFIRQESGTGVSAPLPHWQYSASDNTRWAVSSYPEMVSSNTTVDFIDIPYRHVAVSPQQQRLRLAQNLANGGSLDYYLIGRLDNHADRSGFEAVKEIFHYHAANEQAYAGMRPKADAVLLTGRGVDGAEFRGWFRMLAENHFLFDTLRADVAAEIPLDKYRALILPACSCMGDALADRLDRFAAEGGVLIAPGQTGWRDDQGELRAEPPPKCLGVERIERVREDMRPSYFEFADKAGFGRFADTDLVYMDGPYVYARYAADADKRLKLVPPHDFGPPERCYYTTVTDHPAFVVHPFAKGKGIYIPWLPGRLFHRQGHTNTSDFIADLLESAAGLTPVARELSPMVEVTLMARPDGSSQLVHLVNGSGHFGTSFFAPVVMCDLKVTVPQERRPKSVKALVSGHKCDHTWRDGVLTIELPRLELFEALQIQQYYSAT